MNNFKYSGHLVEEELAIALNDKKVKDLSKNLKDMLRCLFGALDYEEIVSCKLTDGSIKPDIIITYKKINKGVSIKSGRAEIVHNEKIANFLNYLKEKGISDKTLETIALFHFGDGTTDGNGNYRLPYDKVYQMYKERISEANIELNKDIDFVKEVVTRLVFKGANEDNIEADAIYFGDQEEGVLATKRQILKNLQRRPFDFYENLHIGPILIRPDSRYVDKEIADKKKRLRIIAYWPHLQSEIDFVSKRYDYWIINQNSFLLTKVISFN